MKRVLIVTPNWPPISCPDLHRARMALPYFADCGWEPLILKFDPDEQEGIRDPMLCESVPGGTRTWQAGAIPRSWTIWFGLNSVGLRGLLHLARLGSKVIRAERPSLLFFSTTMFPVMILGIYWKLVHGVPYVLDFQDPWRYERKPNALNPRRTLKQWLSARIADILEPLALRKVSHVVSVSPQYPATLARRYSWLRPEQFTVLPFGAAEGDFELLPRLSVRQSIFAPGDGMRHWVYVGRGGGDMALAARAFFTALRNARRASPADYEGVCIHFIGTDYAPPDRSRKTIEPIAVECGVGDMVEEISTRIPYFEALCCLQDADALIVLGSDDGGYTASKIYPYILAKKPLLAIFHEDSSVVGLVRKTNCGAVFTFNGQSTVTEIAKAIEGEWFDPARPRNVQTNWEEFDSYSARKMTQKLCRVFDAVAARGE